MMYADEQMDEAFKSIVEKYKTDISGRDAAGLLELYAASEFELAIEGLLHSLNKAGTKLDAESKEKIRNIAEALDIPIKGL